MACERSASMRRRSQPSPKSSAKAWLLVQRFSAQPERNHPENWVGGLASAELHAIVILFARDVAERERCRQEHREYLPQCDGVEVLSSLDMEAIPPYTYAHEHFGYRDRLSQPVIEGMGEEPTPGSGPAMKAGEFFLGYPDEEWTACEIAAAGGPLPQWQLYCLSPNGGARWRISRFSPPTRRHARTTGMVAAKLMGRWRSGAPWFWLRTKMTRSSVGDMQRTNDFNYGKMDPYGYGCPLGAHIRRMNPRDTAPNMQRRKMIRRGGTYGPPLPEDKPEDGIERGIAAFIGCASLVRQFEFAMNVWTNDPNFHELGNERDPFCRHAGRHAST